MSTLTKTLLAAAATMLVAGAAYAATTPAGQDPTHAPAAADLKGPCDEAEHATDPRCTGAQVREDRHNEAEHANRHRDHDGGVAHEAENENEPNDVGDDNRDPGSLNSGPGNAEDRGGDGVMDDNSGPGSQGSEHSGSGHSGSDDSGSDGSGSGGSGHG